MINPVLCEAIALAVAKYADCVREFNKEMDEEWENELPALLPVPDGSPLAGVVSGVYESSPRMIHLEDQFQSECSEHGVALAQMLEDAIRMVVADVLRERGL